jgi:ArsR family transcriptional regulator
MRIKDYNMGKVMKEIKNIARIFKALADETRLRILYLLQRRELCVCEIVKVLGISQSKASRHLAYLKNAGLVEDRRKGVWIYYSLDSAKDQFWQHLMTYLNGCLEGNHVLATDLAKLEEVGKENLCED